MSRGEDWGVGGGMGEREEREEREERRKGEEREEIQPKAEQGW